jgi:hypothetical protein
VREAESGFEALEERLARRAPLGPPLELRARVVGDIQRARATERRAWLIACAAALLALCVVRATMPAPDAEPRPAPRVAALEHELVHLGFAEAEAERLALVWSHGSVAPLAPVQASRSLDRVPPGGR